MKKIKLLSIILFSICSIYVSAQTTVVDSIISGGIYRSYRLYIPAAYNGTIAYPLILNLHGYTSNASAQQTYSNFAPIADTAHFLMVYPQGTTYNGQPYWNAFGAGPNDIQFLSELIDSIGSNYNVDINSIYSCGMSNGGYMSHTLACELNTKIAAIASVTGSMSTYTRSTCTSNRAVPVMQISGTGDGTVSYTGSTGSLPIDTVVKYWRIKNNCNPTAVFNSVPNTNTSDGCTAEHYVYNNGTAGASVELYKIIGGGHTWPGSPYIVGVTNEDFNASEKIWLFFRKYKLNQFVGVEELQRSSEISMFPNPCNNVLTIDGENILFLIIYDINGRMIINTTEKQIDISKFAQGIYSVVFISGNNRTVKKLVKM
jgi:polyhydroxybutyrate depolymerase